MHVFLIHVYISPFYIVVGIMGSQKMHLNVLKVGVTEEILLCAICGFNPWQHVAKYCGIYVNYECIESPVCLFVTRQFMQGVCRHRKRGGREAWPP